MNKISALILFLLAACDVATAVPAPAPSPGLQFEPTVNHPSPTPSPPAPCTAIVSPGGVWNAVQALKPGSVLCFGVGTFESVYLKNSGTPSAWITLRGQQGTKVVANNWAGIDAGKQSYVVIEGFDVTSPTGRGISASGHHVVIRSNTVHDCAENGIGVTHADYVTIEGNKVFRNAFTSPNSASGISIWEPTAFDALPGYHFVIRGNESAFNDNKFAGATDGNGIIIDDFRLTQVTPPGPVYAHATLVEDNLVHDNGGDGIRVYQSDNVTLGRWNNSHHNGLRR